MIPDLAGVALSPIRIGDRRRTARGWLVVSSGAVRGILSAGRDGEVIHAFACDRRITPEGGLMVFRDLDETLAWLERRLPAERPPSRRNRLRSFREDRPVPLTLADAERELLGAAVDYCSSLRHRSLPEAGPQRRLWNSFVAYSRIKRSATVPGGARMA
jgi:hypothetical protein